MQLAEQVRDLTIEENLLNDGTWYQQSTNVDWTTHLTKSIVLTATKTLLATFKAELYGISSGNARVCVDGVPIVSAGLLSGTTGAQVEREAYITLAAGTYSFTFQLAKNSGNMIRFIYCSIGVVSFLDLAKSDGDASVSVPATSTATIITKVLTSSAVRTTPLGNIKKHNCIVIVNGLNASDGTCTSKMSGTVADRLSFRIYVNGVEKSWTEAVEDYQVAIPANGEGAYGRYEFVADLNTEYTIEVKCYNGFAVAKTARAYISIVICPWILIAAENEPFSIDVPQGSTLYVMLEPLTRNPTKYIKLGKVRSKSFGESTDYYSLSNGVDILAWTYNFETVKPESCNLVAYGFGGCISHIAVDVR
jgi:hypothetical protein